MPTVIQASNLGKRYRLGSRKASASSFRDALARGLMAPLHNLRRLRGLGHTDGAHADDLVWALQEVSFEVGQSEVLGIVGNNGAGKSTLLKVLSRITSPTTGRAVVVGRIGSLLEVGTGFHPELTGRDNIYLNGAILGMERSFISNRFDEIVEFAQVSAFLDTPVKHYSSGMYLRLAFAVAAHLPAEILVVDEVLAVGDAEFQRKCLGKMSDVAGEGRTILFVSHNLNAVQRLCPRSILLERGRLVADGETGEVLQRYLALDATSLGPGRWIDLASTGRTGSHEVRMEAIRYGSDLAELGFQAYSDGPLELKIAVVTDVRRSIGSLGLSVQGESGAKLVEVDTTPLCPELPLRAGRNVIRLGIDSLHLSPGVYQLGLWITDPVTKRAVDRLDSALPLQVVDPSAVPIGRRGATTCRLQVLSID